VTVTSQAGDKCLKQIVASLQISGETVGEQNTDTASVCEIVGQWTVTYSDRDSQAKRLSEVI